MRQENIAAAAQGAEDNVPLSCFVKRLGHKLVGRFRNDRSPKRPALTEGGVQGTRFLFMKLLPPLNEVEKVVRGAAISFVWVQMRYV